MVADQRPNAQGYARDLHVNAQEAQEARTSACAFPAPSAASWLPPQESDAKLNVDGGISRKGDRGAEAVICRDKTGQYLGASAMVFDGLVDPATLEARACSEALALASDLNL